MEFRDLKKQYESLKPQIDKAVSQVLTASEFISGIQVKNLEERLSDYTGAKHCITCANGTDALMIALMAWNISEGDAVFVPDFTFFASGEVVSFLGATPVFVDVEERTFNISSVSLEKQIEKVLEKGELRPKVILAVDLFGQPANYKEIKAIADKYHLLILEDAAQGFGGKIGERKACCFGDISTTSFFPAKPLGCYGDGGAIFTDNEEWADIIRSLCVHGKGTDKYDNIRIGVNSRLDSIQAAVLLVKMDAFENYELNEVNEIANQYSKSLDKIVKTPVVLPEFYSSWAQYTILLKNQETRDLLNLHLEKRGIPSIVYYKKPMHLQKAFHNTKDVDDLSVSKNLCDCVLSLPMHPYLKKEEIKQVVDEIHIFIQK